MTFTYLSGSRLELAAVKDRFVGKFQATTDSYYQLRLVVITPDTAQDIMYFKNLVIGEQEPNAEGAIDVYLGLKTGASAFTILPNETGIDQTSKSVSVWQVGDRVKMLVTWAYSG